MANITDSKRNAMLAIVGAPENIDDLENLYLQTLGATADIHINNQWFEVFVANGYTGNNWNDGAYFFLGTLGATALHINDRWLYFWDTLGGVVGPVVTIALNSGGSCDYIDPDTTCLASGTYEANDFGFTNPANSWVWSIVSGAAAIQGSTTEKTVVVTTNDVGADVDFVLKVIATDTVSTDSAERESALKQDHDNVTEAPAYIGPNINDRDYTVDVPITPVDTFNLFTGDALVFTLEGTWPTGLVIDSASGQITGTPTGALQAYPNLFVRVTNSKGIADSTQLTITLTSSVVAPLFDNGPVPDQDWPIDQAIAQFPIGQFFLTGSFPRTYTIESGAFPTGITMNTAGQINGTPTVEGETGSVVIRCTNSAGFALTNEWNWLTWEALAFIGPILTQEATVGVEFTHDYSQYFTGTVSGYVINAASWPPDTVFDTNTGIATFTPTVEFTNSNAVVVAESNYTPAFVISNNFTWDVTAVALPAFYALTPDPVTKQLLMQRTGVGVPTVTHTSTVYGQDQDGIYQPYSANKPVWVGGRYVDEDNVFADVTPGGADIVPQPYLQYYPAAENKNYPSNDLTSGTWQETGSTDVAAYNAVGLTGAPNTASTLTDDSPTVNERITRTVTPMTADTNPYVYRIFVKKDADQTRFPLFWTLAGNTTYYSLNTATGEAIPPADQTNDPSARVEVKDAGLWWEVLIQQDNGNNPNAAIFLAPARSSTLGGSVSVATTGSIIVGNVELYENSTIEQIRTLSPVFTTTASVAVDRTNYPYDSANSSDGTSAWYCEVTSEGAQDIIDGFLSVTGTNWQLSDGTTTVTRPWTAGTEHQVGIAYGDGQMSIKVDATWSADVAYDGTMLQGILDLFRAGAFGGKMRELQRFDAASYAAAQAIINGLTP